MHALVRHVRDLTNQYEAKELTTAEYIDELASLKQDPDRSELIEYGAHDREVLARRAS